MRKWWRELCAAPAELGAVLWLERRVRAGLPPPEVYEELAVLRARRCLRDR